MIHCMGITEIRPEIYATLFDEVIRWQAFMVVMRNKPLWTAVYSGRREEQRSSREELLADPRARRR